jgi:hypothetical protein
MTSSTDWGEREQKADLRQTERRQPHRTSGSAKRTILTLPTLEGVRCARSVTPRLARSIRLYGF